ncbi:MAG: Rne/Rng family ribonuclease, partial [Armatimonadetes bacterium CG_4_10_14_3_um_filter_59_10]
METEIIVNVHPKETRVGILEDGRLTELHIERGEKVVGNIYKGKVNQVVTGLDAAFVDIGLERNAFLHVDDALDEEPDRRQRGKGREQVPPIRQVVKDGQELLVQVTKGPVGTKGA